MATTIDSTGLTRDRLDVIIANIEAAAKGIFGDDIDLDPSSLDSQAIGSTAEGVNDTNELLELVYLSRSISGATGAALSRLVQLIGISRNGASYSTADVVHTGTPGTVVPSGSLIDTTATPAANFQTVGDVTIDGTGTIPGTVRATATGPVFGAAGAISVIKTIISGWASVTNAAAVNLGSDQELDSALRARHRASVAINSKSVADSLYAALANIQGVSDARIFENKTGVPQSRAGSIDLPPNSIQVIVQGGADADIATAIWAKASAGVTLAGAMGVSVPDSQGVFQLIKFDRPIQQSIYSRITFYVPPGLTVSQDQQDAARRALVDYGKATAKIGQRISWAALFAPVVAVIRPPFGLQLITISLNSIPNLTDQVVPFNAIPSWDVSNVAIFFTSLDYAL